MAEKTEGKKDKGKKKNPEYLYHYLSLKNLILILKNKRLSFCNPSYWDDKNDSYFTKLAMPEGKAFGVICFTKTRETCTHWKTFASKGIGVKITFMQKELLDSLVKNINQNEKILKSSVCYRARKNVLKASVPEIDRCFTPLFLKKSAYIGEKEYRVVCMVDDCACGYGKVVRQVEIPLSCISRLTISPYVKKTVANDVIKLLREYIKLLTIDGAETLNIELMHSTMMCDKKWQRVGREFKKLVMNAECAKEVVG